MCPDTYLALCNTLKQNGFLRSSRYVKITEQVVVFFLLMAHNWSQRNMAYRLQRSLHTVSIYCRKTCKAICRLGKTIIQPTQTMKPHPVVARNGSFYPWFSVSNACPFYLSPANIFKIIAITYRTILTDNMFIVGMYRCY